MATAATGCGKQKIEPIAVGHRVVHGGPDYDRPVVVDRTCLTRLERYSPLAPLHQPNNLAPIRSCSRAARICRRSPASTRRFIAVTAPSPIILRSPNISITRASGATDFMDCRTNTSPAACAKSHRISPKAGDRRSSGKRRFDVRAGWPKQRRKHDGIYRSRRAADGHAAGPDRSRCLALSDTEKA